MGPVSPSGRRSIGILILQAILLQGASQVDVVDKNTARADFAGKFGARNIRYNLDDLAADTYDIVIDATGALPVLQRTLEFVRPGGKVLWFGVPPSGGKIEIEPFVVYHKGLTVLSSFTSVRNSYQALDLLRSGRISVEGLVSHRLPLDESNTVSHPGKGLEDVRKVQILPNGWTGSAYSIFASKFKETYRNVFFRPVQWNR
jgi:threonine dehydrogenase-like Zn-dependent dehydrogenase